MQEFQIEEFVFARAQAILADNFDCDVDSYLKRQIFQYYFPDQSSPLDLSFEEVKTRVSCLVFLFYLTADIFLSFTTPP